METRATGKVAIPERLRRNVYSPLFQHRFDQRAGNLIRMHLLRQQVVRVAQNFAIVERAAAAPGLVHRRLHVVYKDFPVPCKLLPHRVGSLNGQTPNRMTGC